MTRDVTLVAAVLLDQMLHRVPGLESLGVKQFVNGPESFTPDGKYIMGESPEVSTPT